MISFGRLSVGKMAPRLLARVIVGNGGSSLQGGASSRSRNDRLSTRSEAGVAEGGSRFAAMKHPRRQVSATPKGDTEPAEAGLKLPLCY